MALVAAWKKDLVNELVQDMREAPVVAVVDMEGIPGHQVQSMRAGLRAIAKLKMTKNNLMLLAIEEAAKDKPGLEALKDAVHGQCAIVTTDIDPFKLFKKLQATMTPAPAKEQRSAPAEGEAPRKKPAVKVTGAKRLPQGDERDEARRRAKEEAERKRRQGGYVPSGWGNRKDDEAK